MGDTAAAPSSQRPRQPQQHHDPSLSDDEARARSKARHTGPFLFLANGWAATLVFAEYLISYETFLGGALSVSMTVFCYYRTEDNLLWDGGAMNWVLLSFAVVTPLSASIGMAFRRREAALRYLAAFRATAYNIYCAHAVWDWSKAGKADTTGRASSSLDWLAHADEALTELIGMGDELCRFLTLPSLSRARHRVTRAGRAEAGRTADVAYRLFYSLYTVRMSRITLLCEAFKREGLPPNEATRIRQWERMIGEQVENLRIIKVYRTPQALRSFSRLFTVLLPPFYAPSYAQLARDVQSLGLGIAFAILTTVALTSLFECVIDMEDPFMSHLSLDGIDVHEELAVLHYQQLTNSRDLFFPDAERPFLDVDNWTGRVTHGRGSARSVNGETGGRKTLSRTSSFTKFRETTRST